MMRNRKNRGKSDSPKPSGTAQLTVTGELTVSGVAAFQKQALEALDRANALTLTLAGAEYLDVAAFQCLSALRLEAAIRGATLTIEQIPNSVQKDAAILGMQAALGPTE
jgi:ABC-type transporter Mla MlaB component